MALSNSQMQSILRGYDATKDKNRILLDTRIAFIKANAPEYFDIHSQLVLLSTSFATRDIPPSSEDLNAYKSDMKALKLKKLDILTNLGLEPNFLDPIYDCPDCKDTGFLVSSKCHCLTQKISSLLYEQSGIRNLLELTNFSTLSYDYYEGEDLENFKIAVDASKHFIADFPTNPSNIIFYGTVGCGKSFLSGCIAKQLMDSGNSVIYFSSIALFDILHENGLYRMIEELYNYKLLIIDDLGSEMTNSFVSTAFFSLLNERQLRNLPVIISTNLNLSELTNRYSERIVSRIIQNFTICKLSGPDIRIKQRFENRK